MNNTLLILAEDPEKAKECARLLTDSDYILETASPKRSLAPAIIVQLFLIIVPDGETLSPPTLADLRIPTFVPVLMLGGPSAPPPGAANGHSTRLTDYLGGQPDAELLKARIGFLRKVAKLGFERDSYLKNHEAFLDWFASRDGLTGLFNRHHFNQKLPDHYQSARANGTELSLLHLDIDYFNDINKSCGQHFGDFVLNEMSARLTSASRREAICFRISGGEFVVLMPDADLATAREAARNIMACCESKLFSRNGMERAVTLSIGIASLTSHRPASTNEFVNMAETALFKAKAEGRNRVQVYAPPGCTDPLSPHHDFDTVKVTISRVLEKTRTSAVSSLQLLARDVAGPGHKEHIDRVTRYIELFCKQLGLTLPIIKTLQNAAILHTSIRHLIHNDLLAKQEMFSQEDLEIMRDFPYKLSEIVGIFDYFAEERLILLTRTEKFDGSGYPDGLKGQEIPIGARIISVVDSFAAMEANRPHRPRLSPATILQELKNEAGRQFDPFLVLKLLDIIQYNSLLEINEEDVAAIRADLLSIHAKQEL